MAAFVLLAAAAAEPVPPRDRCQSIVEVGGIKVTFEVPGVVLVLTDVNARKSMSGSVPLIVSRD
jgi:hypothetical protein